jgi:hypothetical protein
VRSARIANVAKRNADPLYNPGAGLSGQTLYAAAKHVTDAQIDPSYCMRAST